MSGGAFLERMAAASRRRVRVARAELPASALAAAIRSTPRPPTLALGTFDVIAEVKLRSPATGPLETAEFDLRAQVAAYAHGGACAVSVLTEPTEFHGSLEHLRDAAAHLARFDVPVMRKDFLTDPYQVLEARAAGASGVLLIVTMLDDAELADLVECAREHGLFVLLEAFDGDDLARLARVPLGDGGAPVLAGVNCRDLRTLEVDLTRFAEHARELPAHLPGVAESGIRSAADIATVAGLGYRLALVGSALMQSADVAATLERFIAAGRTGVVAG